MRWIRWGLIVVIIIVVLLGIGEAIKRAKPTQEATATPGWTKPLKGVSYSPRSSGVVDQADFYTKASQAGQAVEWVGDWQQLATSSSAPYSIYRQTVAHSLTPIIIASLYDQGKNTLLRPLSADNLADYQAAAKKLAQTNQPPYFGMGVEINILAKNQPEAYKTFVQLFSDTTAIIKSVSPQTKVFTVFQLEKMKGLNGGLFGGLNDTTANQWALLADFPGADLIAFTSYPNIIYKSPAEIPSDYYEEAQSQTDKPIAFSELGWHSSASPKGWESNETEQAEFVGRLAEVTRSQQPEFIIWSFLYDLIDIDPFRGMALYSANEPRASWSEWLKIGSD